jgi:hypothetical protein
MFTGGSAMLPDPATLTRRTGRHKRAQRTPFPPNAAEAALGLTL